MWRWSWETQNRPRCIGGIISQEQSAGHRKKRRAKHVGVAHEA